MEYREEVQRLLVWCSAGNLLLNISGTGVKQSEENLGWARVSWTLWQTAEGSGVSAAGQTDAEAPLTPGQSGHWMPELHPHWHWKFCCCRCWFTFLLFYSLPHHEWCTWAFCRGVPLGYLTVQFDPIIGAMIIVIFKAFFHTNLILSSAVIFCQFTHFLCNYTHEVKKKQN